MQAKEIVRNTVKEKLARNEIVASMTVRLVRGIEIAQIAKTAGFDMFYIDIEHSSFSLDITGQICLAALSAGITPMVRVPSNTSEYISRVLDGGALGVIAPHIGSAEEARAVVKAAKFLPLGARSVAGGLPHLHFRSFPAAEASAALNDATMAMVQFENAAALAKAEEIVAVEGIDMVMIGTNDLLCDWGIPGQYEHPKVREAYETTIAAWRRPGQHVGVGGPAARPQLLEENRPMGAPHVSPRTHLPLLMGPCAPPAPHAA